MFLKYYKIILQQDYLFITIVSAIIILLLDNLLIYNHSNLLTLEQDLDTEIALEQLLEVETETDTENINYNLDK